VAGEQNHTLELADDGSAYIRVCVTTRMDATTAGALSLDPSVQEAARAVSTPQRITVLRVACKLSRNLQDEDSHSPSPSLSRRAKGKNEHSC
jgi:hypothetical protein